MSTLIAQRNFIFTTKMGTIVVKERVVEDFDVEDIVRDQAVAQARTLRLVDLGKQIEADANIPTNAIPSAFITDEEDEEEIEI